MGEVDAMTVGSGSERSEQPEWTERTERVEFRGSRTAAAPLTWAQQEIFPRVWTPRPGAAYFNVFFWLPVPADRKTADVLAAVEHAMNSCEALRTRYSLDTAGQPWQEAHDAGHIDVSILETTAEFTDSDAERLQFDLGKQAFDYSTSWPVRFTVTTYEARPTYLLAVVSHLSIDAGGRIRLREILTKALRDGPPAASDQADVPQMIERASWEASAEGQRRSARSLRGWGDLVRRLPTVTTFPGTSDPDTSSLDTSTEPVEPRRPLVELSSPAAARAAAILAARHAVGTPAVFLAASASLVAALSGYQEIALGTMAANRSSPAETALVGMLAQSSIAAVDTQGTSFGEVVRHAQSSVLRAVGVARFDPAQWRTLNDEFVQSGRPLSPDVLHNDARELSAAPADDTEPGDSADPSALLTQSQIRVLGNIAEHSLHFNVTLFGDESCVLWRLWLDRWYVVAPDASDLLLAAEALLVRAASGDDSESPVEWLRDRLRENR
jgi:hypothetical protein